MIYFIFWKFIVHYIQKYWTRSKFYTHFLIIRYWGSDDVRVLPRGCFFFYILFDDDCSRAKMFNRFQHMSINFCYMYFTCRLMQVSWYTKSLITQFYVLPVQNSCFVIIVYIQVVGKSCPPVISIKITCRICKCSFDLEITSAIIW